MQFNIATWITFFRIILIPFFIMAFYLPFYWNYILCTIIFSFSAITDWFDGFLARRLKQTSNFGRFLDPVADKIIVIISLIMITDHFHKWFITIPIIILIIREIFILALRAWLAELKQEKKIFVSFLSKIKTTMQMFSIFILLFYKNTPIKWIGVSMLYIASIFTLWSMIQYVYSVQKDLLK